MKVSYSCLQDTQNFKLPKLIFSLFRIFGRTKNKKKVQNIISLKSWKISAVCLCYTKKCPEMSTDFATCQGYVENENELRDDFHKKTAKRMNPCKKEGGGLVKIIISNFKKRMTNF